MVGDTTRGTVLKARSTRKIEIHCPRKIRMGSLHIALFYKGLEHTWVRVSWLGGLL